MSSLGDLRRIEMNHEHDGSEHDVNEGRAGFDRRSFMKLAGFSFAGTLLAGCRQADVEKAIPFLVQPEEIMPGLAYWYATTCGGCNAGCGVLAKCRDGRPIKLEGNPAHPVSRGGLCAMGQASLLGLYDSHRLKNPIIEGQEASWDRVDAEMALELNRIRDSGGPVRFLSGTITGPTARATINRFLAGFADARHIEYDAVSCSAILDAHGLTHGRRILPRYHFDRAEVIASFDADFLGVWLSPVEFTKGYAAGRTLEGRPPKCSFVAQFESRVSLTGSNADQRICMSPAEILQSLKRLAKTIGRKAGTSIQIGESGPSGFEKPIDELAVRLWDARGKSLVVCGVNDVRSQLLVNAINEMLGDYGATVDIERPSYQYAGNDGELLSLLEEIHAGKVSALFINGTNPVYDLPGGTKLAGALETIPLVVSFAERLDETSEHARYVCPEPHSLEAWRDTESVAGVVAVAQPTLQPLTNARPLVESLSAWMGAKQSAHDLIQAEWERSIFRRQSKERAFGTFWEKVLEDGFSEVTSGGAKSQFDRSVLSLVLNQTKTSDNGEFALVLYPSLTMLDGRHAHNPWLHELPDPVTKVVWGNYISVSKKTAAQGLIAEGDIVQITVRDAGTLELPAHIQPGQHDSVLAIGLGFGRKGTDRFDKIGPKWLLARPTVQPGDLVGRNAALFLTFAEGGIVYSGRSATLSKTGRSGTLVAAQEYHSLYIPNLTGAPTETRRQIIQETSLGAFSADPAAGSFPRHALESMWPENHTYPGHRWGMVVDLNACTGCSACVVGCQAENNIPVVGRDEVRRNRELTWIRIDRYYDESDGDFTVSHQPMMCQHCGNAPCETVCPVLATVHSEEGLNQQVYNRCVGTRYCANNCPYKIRRFNWFQYPRGDEMRKMVLNPDVTVRDRGVMEKCSFCFQRIQLGKIEAKREGRRVRDIDIQPACAQSCPAGAIVFGDMNDPNSEVSQRMNDPRFYRVLEELGVRPSVGYMTLVRNRDETKGEVQHG